MTRTKILICNSEVGAGKRGASLGPDAIRIAAVNAMFGLFEQLPVEEVKTKVLNKYSPEYQSAKYIKLIKETHQKIGRKMAETHRAGYNTLIFSGDHSNAAGFFSGFREAYPQAKLGLIWIDAHGDIHSPFTSPSGNVHGMPIAILLDCDHKEDAVREVKPEVARHWKRIKEVGKRKIHPKILPEDLLFIDIRDLEDQEWKAIRQMGIKHYTPDDRKRMGIEKIIQQTTEYFAGYDGVYVSFDVDSMDPSISMGTGTPVEGGISEAEAVALLTAFTRMPNFKSLEVTEVNPLLDTENKMAKTVVGILQQVYKDGF